MLAGLFWLALQPVSDFRTPLNGILVYLAVVNLVLALFNLVPAYPMDGGRIFRSIVWGITGNFRLATTVAAWGGQLFGIAFAVWGVVRVLQGNAGGLLLVLVGLFLFAAAAASARRPEGAVDEASQPVSSAMWTSPVVAPPHMPLDEAVHDVLLHSERHVLFVCEGDRLLGTLTGPDAAAVSISLWGAVPVIDAMGRPSLPGVRPDDSLQTAILLLWSLPHGEIPVVDGGRLVGSLSASDVLALLHGPDPDAGAR